MYLVALVVRGKLGEGWKNRGMQLGSPGTWLCHKLNPVVFSESFNFSGLSFLLSKMSGLCKISSEEPPSANIYLMLNSDSSQWFPNFSRRQNHQEGLLKH